MSRDDARMAWFAGMFDGEGSCGMLRAKRSAVTVRLHFGLANYEVVREARDLVGSVLGRELTIYAKKPRGLERLPSWTFAVVANRDVYDIGLVLRPLLRVKQLELDLVLSFVSRALRAGYSRQGRYTATGLDFEMARLCARLKRGDSVAAERARLLLSQHPPVFDREELVDAEYKRWQEWYRRGVPAGAIARHVGATHHMVKRIVADVVQEGTETARDLGLTPQPSWPKDVAEVEVLAWREAVMRGETARQVALRYRRHPQYVQAATCDIRWHKEGEDS